MSTSGASVPALIAAFAFGIVVNAASAALFLHINGHGAAVFRDGQRLVLTTFLLSAALWAQTDFISIAIDADATSSCQIGVIFSTAFDQLGRFSIEQYLLWAINKGAKSGVMQMAGQALLVARFVLGAVFVGFSRPLFDPVCVPDSSMLPIAVIVVVIDAVIIAALAIRAFTTGLVGEVRTGRSDSARSKSILLVIIAFAIWTATSVTMLLGMDSTALLLRTMLPAIGLLVLVFVVTACNDPLTTSVPRPPRAPESPGVRNITTGRSISTDDSSDYPPSRFEDLKRSDVMSVTAFEQPRSAPRPDVPPIPSNFARPATAENNDAMPLPPVRKDSMFITTRAAPTPAPNAQKVDVRPDMPKAKRSLRDLKGGPGANRMKISNPILEANGDQNPLNKIATISLEDAARNERERRAIAANDLQRESALIAKRPAPQPPNLPPEEALKRATSLKRKEVASVSSQPPIPTGAHLEPMPVAVTSSAQLSPGVEELRRRSPRQLPVDSELDMPVSSRSAATPSAYSPAVMPSPTVPLPAPQQEQMDQPDEADQMDHMEEPEEMQFMTEPEQAAAEILTQPAAAPPRQIKVKDELPPPPVGPDPTIMRPNIRPSRQLPQAPKTPLPEPSKTALQRRATNGLPGNPRAMAVKALAKEAGVGRQQTVMFMNNIVYDNPEAVQSIIDDANTKEDKRRSNLSIVHRPRPIPRHTEKDRAIFPAEPSPNLAGHRRSRSGGSIIGRKSILQSNPGSPTQLPPLPLPPKNKAPKMERPNPTAERPHPNDTKSMTFDEKMTLLFPTPPSGDGTQRRRSSVPEMPPLPKDFMPITMSPIDGFDGDVTSRLSMSTNRTGRTSIKTENILEVDELPRRNVVRMSEDQPHSVSDDVGNSWLPGIASDRMMMRDEIASRPSMGSNSVATAGRKRASSPVLPPARDSTSTVSTDSQTRDDATTNWGSIHSPVAAMPISANLQVARTTYINGERGGAADSTYFLPSTTYKGRADSPPVSDEDDELWRERDGKRESQWHRRVGDNLPTFSGRKERMSRKMPPPHPLLLNNRPSTKNPVIVKAAEPSPLESPEQALAFIQAQLKKYEEPNMAGTETPSQRLALLDNLEKEMDMQAGHWRDMQHDLRHDSLSSMQTLSPAAESRRQSVISNRDMAKEVQPQQTRMPAVAVSIGADRRAARRSRIQGATVGKPITEEVATAKPAPTIGGTMASRSGLVRKDSTSGKKPYMTNMTDLGSPTPPDSDDSDGEREVLQPQTIGMAISTSLAKESQNTGAASGRTLWTPSVKEQQGSNGMLWTAVPKAAHQLTTMFATAPSSVHSSSSRKSAAGKKNHILSGPLPIESASLWTVRAVTTERAPEHGLWAALSHPESHHETKHQELQPEQQPQWEQQPQSADEKMEELELELEALEADRQRMSSSGLSQKAPRPLTQRPPRRSKRVTMLPDILESPEPLPDKRGTLGIFQFPWGEKSDTAKIPSRGTPFMAMPGTMASGGGQINAALEARAKQLEAQEYSSSFFDDYDDDDEGYDDEDQGFDEDGSGSDDGFDENTLWEIASLLKTEQVPSTLSLFPPPLSTGSVVGDYIAEMPSDHEGKDEEEDERDMEVNEIIGLRPGARNMVRDSELWSEQKVSHKKSTSVAEPDKETWKAYDNVSQAATIRAKPRMSEAAKVETKQLWDQAPLSVTKPVHSDDRASLWAAPSNKKARSSQQHAAKMWTPRTKKTSSGATDKAALFSKEAAAASKASAIIRTTDQEPAALNMPRTPRTPKHTQLEKLMSSSLWTSASGHTSRMWAPMPIPKVWAKEHLFDRDVAAVQKLRAPIRTTSMEPAALNMVRVPRSLAHMPALRLTSTSLWNADSVKHAKAPQYNWIMAEDGKSLPVVVDDTIVSSNVGVKPTTWWEKMKAAAGMSSQPTAPVIDTAKAAEAEIDQVRMALKTTPLLPAQQQYLQRPAASQNDWNAALQEAVEASYPWLQRRISATPNQWQAALDRALSRSYPVDVARQHPVFAGHSSVDHVVSKLVNDASKVHPVFFQPEEKPQPQQPEEPRQMTEEEMLAQIEALEREREIAASHAHYNIRDSQMLRPQQPLQQQQPPPPPPQPKEEVIVQLKQSAPVPDQVPLASASQDDTAYRAHIVAMENQAAARLQALEGASRGVVLRY